MNEHAPLKNENQSIKPDASNKRKISFVDLLMVIVAILIASSGFALPYLLPATDPIIVALAPYAGVLIAILFFVFLTNIGKSLRSYFKNSFNELKKVVWPPRQDTLRMTGFVIVFVAILSLFIYGVDTLISWLFFDVLLRRG